MYNVFTNDLLLMMQGLNEIAKSFYVFKTDVNSLKILVYVHKVLLSNTIIVVIGGFC